jgi:hypothetical protein
MLTLRPTPTLTCPLETVPGYRLADPPVAASGALRLLNSQVQLPPLLLIQSSMLRKFWPKYGE